MTTAAQNLVPELENEAASTRRLLERVPGDRLDWQPHPKSMTLGQLALHVARIPGDLSRLAAADGVDANTVDFTPPKPVDRDSILAAFEVAIADAKTFLTGLDDTAAAAPWKLRAGDQEVFTMPRLGLVRSLLFNHWYHHRGQLGVYLRMLDVPLPVIYGRSADENPFTGLPA